MILESHCIPENELADGDSDGDGAGDSDSAGDGDGAGDSDGAGAGDGGGDDNEDDTAAGPKVLAHVDLTKTICE